MLKRAVLISALLLTPVHHLEAQTPADGQAVPVEVVATAADYVPRTTSISHPGRAFTNCSGTTSYFGHFDADTGRLSGTADTDTLCSSTYTPPSESTLTEYRRVNYTLARDGQTLYLLSCTQVWRLSRKTGLLLGTIGGSEAADRAKANGMGHWADCPAFGIGNKYTLAIRNSSDATLESAASRKPGKLEYWGSAAVPVPTTSPPPQTSATTQVAVTNKQAGTAIVHVTSSPNCGEIYIDGKFFGNAPSDIALAPGEHAVRVTLGGKEWTRNRADHRRRDSASRGASIGPSRSRS
jgi:hypothetical protein